MFISGKTRAAKTYAYQMRGSLKFLDNLVLSLKFSDKLVRCEADFVEQNPIFCRTLSDVQY